MEDWKRYIERVRRLTREDLEAKELNYKMETEQGLEAVRRAVLAETEDSGWVDLLRKNPLHKHLNKLCYRRRLDRLLSWTEEDRTGARDALRRLWADDSGTATTNASTEETLERIRVFVDELPPGIGRPGGNMTVTSVLLMARGAERHPPFGLKVFEETYEKIGHPSPGKVDEVALYKHALEFLDRLIEESEKYGLDLPTNRLEAQSVVWALERWGRV